MVGGKLHISIGVCWFTTETSLTTCPHSSLEKRMSVKMSKKAPGSVEFNFLLIAIDLDRNGFRRIKEEGQIYKTLPHIF